MNFCFHHTRGEIRGVISQAGLERLVLPCETTPRTRAVRASGDDALASMLAAALERYFAGTPEDFSGIPLDLTGATPFRRAVWMAAREIPWGQTTSYAGLAKLMGRGPGAARAVGQALGANPTPIVVPCHRILAAGGGLGGFGAGLAWKRELLALEGSAMKDEG